jgi:hypothetical protein
MEVTNMSSDETKVIARDDEPQQARVNDEMQAPAAAFVTKAGAVVFMSQFEKELESACQALKEMKICGSVSDFSEPEVEIRYRVCVALTGIFPHTTQVEVFHQLGSQLVRFNTQEGIAYDLHLGIRPGTSEPGLYSDNGQTLMGPEKAARFILEPMARRIRSKLGPAVS